MEGIDLYYMFKIPTLNSKDIEIICSGKIGNSKGSIMCDCQMKISLHTPSFEIQGKTHSHCKAFRINFASYFEFFRINFMESIQMALWTAAAKHQFTPWLTLNGEHTTAIQVECSSISIAESVCELIFIKCFVYTFV